MPLFGAVLFSSTSAAIRAEKVLLGAGLTVKLIPTPRELSSDCGLALRFAWADIDRVRATLAGAHLAPDGVHPLVDKHPHPEGGPS
jgi:hypothetical protein